MCKMNAIVMSVVFCLTISSLADARSRMGAAYSITLDDREVDESSLSLSEEERLINNIGDSDDNFERRSAQNQQEQRVYDLTNAARKIGRSCGGQWYPAVGQLAWNDQLVNAARGHASDMRNQDYFSHTSKDGRSPTIRIENAGYRNWCANGENIAGNSNADSTVDSWLKSPGHCANLMNSNFRDIGIGYASGGRYGGYWVQNFARRC